MEGAFRVELTDAQINNAIAVALAESFTAERRDSLIRDVIRAHLDVKPSTYSKETLLAKVVGEQVRQMVNARLLEKVREWEPQVHAVVDRTLGPSARDAVCQSLSAALQRVSLADFTVSVSTTVKE